MRYEDRGDLTQGNYAGVENSPRLMLAIAAVALIELQMRMIGDFNGSANSLWTPYGQEAKGHDESRIQTLKGDMDGVLL
jgi:hypothetical protein